MEAIIYENDKNITGFINHLETAKLIDEIKKIKKNHKIYITQLGACHFSNEFKEHIR